jgi:hypothetical protein
MNNQKRAEIISVTLSPEQEMVLGPILDRHAVQSGVAGLLGIVSRSYRSEEGRVTLQLELLPISRRVAAALAKLTRSIDEE